LNLGIRKATRAIIEPEALLLPPRRPEATDRSDTLRAPRDGLVEIARTQTTEGVDRQRGLVREPCKPFPAQGRATRVAGGRQNRGKQRIVEPQSRRPLKILEPVAGGPDQSVPEVLAIGESGQTGTGQMQPVAWNPTKAFRVTVQDQPHGLPVAELERLSGQVPVIDIGKTMGA
jgi:hypothetical protein